MKGDEYGSLGFPVEPPAGGEAAGDPVLRLLLDFVAAVLNANVAEPWKAVCPGRRVVETSYPWNPETEFFSDNNLPSIYAFRSGGQGATQTAEESRDAAQTITLKWVFPLQTVTVARLRAPIITALARAIDRAIYRTRDPAYVHPADPDPASPTFQEEPSAVLLSKSTSTSAVLYGTGGVAFDGVLAGSPFVPVRGVVVALGGPSSAWTDGSQIALTGTDVMGNVVVERLVVDVSKVPCRLYSTSGFASLESIALDGQASTAGTFSAGLGARDGYGTSIVDFGRMDIRVAKEAAFRPVRIRFKNVPEQRIYPAIEWLIDVDEQLVRDPAVGASLAGSGIDQFGVSTTGPGSTMALTNADGRVVADGAFP